MNDKQLSVVITGATSFIGVHLVEEYIKNNYKVIAVVRPNSKNLSRLPVNSLLEIIEVEMKEIESIVEKLANEIDIFYHLAWDGVRVPYRDDTVLQNQNYECAIKAMNVAGMCGCKIFIGSGSQAEYGECQGEIDENYEARPTTEYGKAKLKSYCALKDMAIKNNMEFAWTRIFSVYGKYDYSETLIMSALNKMNKNQDIPLTQCKQNWDYVYVEDVARAMYLLGTTSGVNGIYNIASGKSKPLKEFVMDMKKISNSRSKLKFGVIPYNQEGVVSFAPVVDKLKQKLGWTCQIEFDEGIKRILKSMK